MKLLNAYEFQNISFRNRIVMPPMCLYKADEDGFLNDFHLTHYAARAIGHVGLIIVEATGVEPRGRISDNDLGLWDDAHIQAHQKLNALCHAFGSKTAIQLAHAGRKSICKASTPVAPSALLFSETGGFKTPHALSINEIATVTKAFVEASKRAEKAGYDMIELHSAHGYLLCEFLSPLTNQRDDLYGGSLENRCRLTLEICDAILKAVKIPLLVRISADEWMDKGWSLDDSIYLSARLKALGVAMIHVSAGGNHAKQQHIPHLAPAYQAPYAKRIREEVGIGTISVGLLTTAEQGEALLNDDTCDMVAYGRELLRNPNMVHYFAKENACEKLIEPAYMRAF